MDVPGGVSAAAGEAVDGIVSGLVDPLSMVDMASTYCQPIQVAVVMPSPTNDLAFSQSMYDGLGITTATWIG